MAKSVSPEERIKNLEAIKGKTNSPAFQSIIDEAINRTKITQATAPQDVVANALLSISRALTQAQQAGKSLDANEVVRIVREDLADNRITFDELDTTVQDLLKNKKAQYSFTWVGKGGQTVTATGTVSQDNLTNPLVQLILSDISARNNVYLFGPAGTGKTYIAEVIAEMLGWELITVTCNQFTSPLNLIGGQTIEGYQKGLLERAWGNLDSVNGQRVAGNVLLLDELPKLDPNTAGVMNDALAKVKRRKSIENGRGEKIEMGNCFIVATGNVKLNEQDEDYVANFKQDLSLQDRFVGSCYPILVQYGYQVSDIMKGFLWIWEYMTDLQKAIAELKATSQAFVSNRIMESLRDTQLVYAGYALQPQPSQAQLLQKPKSLLQGVNSFLSLFDEKTRQQLEEGVEIEVEIMQGVGARKRATTTRRQSQSLEDFRKKTADKNNMTPDFSANGYDTPEEIEAAKERAEAHDSLKLRVYQD